MYNRAKEKNKRKASKCEKSKKNNKQCFNSVTLYKIVNNSAADSHIFLRRCNAFILYIMFK